MAFGYLGMMDEPLACREDVKMAADRDGQLVLTPSLKHVISRPEVPTIGQLLRHVPPPGEVHSYDNDAFALKLRHSISFSLSLAHSTE